MRLRYHLSKYVAALCFFSFVVGCGGESETQVEEEYMIAPEGKEDNYFSNVAQEYYVMATPVIELTDYYESKTDEERLDYARQVMQGKTQQIAWFLHLYLIDKSRSDEESDYGGMRAMVLDGSFESTSLRVDPENPLRFTYNLKFQIGGTKSLLQLIQKDNNLQPDENAFELQMAKLTNAKTIRFSHSGYNPGDWSPESCDCELETVELQIDPIPSSPDAYIPIAKMLEDKVVDLSVHFGWDYHARYDISHSRTLYNWLVNAMGFKSPEKSYEEYHRLSGPLTKELTINGEKIRYEITIYRPDPCESWDEAGPYGTWSKEVDKDETYKKRSCPDFKWSDDERENTERNANSTTSAGASHLKDDLIYSLKTRDAIIYTGHSGYTYAYALASWYKTSAGDLDPPEIKSLDLPKDKSQLFVVSGCDTYHVGQAFKENPNKEGLVNADVITTTSFSNSADIEDTKSIIRALVGNEGNVYESMTYGRLMYNLNPRTYLPYSSYSFYSMYGVHGTDDNPLVNPLSDLSKGCQSCKKDVDCGANGNVCVRLNEDEKVCAAECVSEGACGEGMTCRKFGSTYSGYLKGMACVPKTLSCNVEPEETEPKEYIVEDTVEAKEEKRYEIPIGPTAKSIKVALTGTGGDADLYTNFTVEPTTYKYKCRPYSYTSNETCNHKKGVGETLYVMVRGWDPSSDYKLTVTWE